MEPLIEEASSDLADLLSVETVFSPAVNSLDRKFQECNRAIHVVSEQKDEIAKKNDTLKGMLEALTEKQAQLEAAFKKVDQIEIIVNKVKETYNAVAENLDTIEKAVTASTTTLTTNRSNHRQRQQNIPIQPYFPPPNHVDVFNTDELFAAFSSASS